MGQPVAQACYGNPIDVSTGNKFQRETDYAGQGAHPLKFERFYNSSHAVVSTSTGSHWRHSYDRAIAIVNASTVDARRADGKTLRFVLSAGAWTPDADVTDTLTSIPAGGWTYISTDAVETYDSAGKLMALASYTGLTHTLNYDVAPANGGDGNAATLDKITDHFGRTLKLSYDQGRIAQLTDPAGNQFTYGYAAGNLVTVDYPGSGAITRTYHYESLDPAFPYLLTGITDENDARFATWGYDAAGRANSSEHAGGVLGMSVDYRVNGTEASVVTDALNRTQTIGLNPLVGLMRPTQVDGGPGSMCAGQASATTYHASGLVQSRTDFNGSVSTYSHNARRLEQSRTEAAATPDARTITTQWHAIYQLPTQIDEPGRSTVNTYVGGRLTSRTITDTATGESRTTAWTYTAEGLVDTVDGPGAGDTIAYGHDSAGNLIRITNALGHETEITDHDAHGNPLRMVDPNGVVTVMTYDERQRLKTRTAAHGTTTAATTNYAFDAVGQLDRVTLPGGAFLDYDYDDAQRLVEARDNLNNRIRYTLDALGNRTNEEVFDPANTLRRAQSQVFNALGRLEQLKNAAGQVLTQIGYDDQGNRTSQEDFVTPTTSHTTGYLPDALNRIRKVTDAANGEIFYDYNALDQLIKVKDPKGLETNYTLNALGDLKEQDSPDTGTSLYTYDAAGNRATQFDARGVLVGYGYDVLNRLTSVDYPGDAEDVAYSYDSSLVSYGTGRLTGITDQSGTTRLSYDARGNVIEVRRVIGGTAYVTGYSHDVADRLTSISYPSGRTVTYIRNVLGQVSEVTTTVDGSTTTIASGISYLPFGGIAAYTLGNGVAVTRAHDEDYRLEEITDQGASTVQHLKLQYDLRDNINEIEDLANAARLQIFDYDALSRLTFAHGAYGDQEFAYDGVGNRLQQTVTPPGGSPAVTDYTYPAGSHRLTSITGSSFSYDAAGNVTGKGSLALGYNAANRASTVGAVSNVYNAAGQRVIKTAGGENTVFHHDLEGHLIAETSTGDVPAREYVWLGDLPLAIDTVTIRAEVITDNTDPAFSTTGTWTTSTTPAGFHGSNYRAHGPAGAPSGSVIVDDLDPGASFTGVWLPLSLIPPGSHGSLYFRSVGLVPGTFTWNVPLTAPGKYRVYARWVSDPMHAADASYTIAHAGGSAVHSVDQRSGGGQWALLGTYDFGTNASVSLAAQANGAAIADAVRMVPVAPGDTARWSAPEAVTYDVYARWPASATQSKNAFYTVTHAGGAAEVAADQTQGGGQWNLLGRYTFASTAQGVRLQTDPDAPVAADAVRFVPAGSSVTQFTRGYFHTDHLNTPQKLSDASQAVVWEAVYEPFGEAVVTSQPYFDNPLRFPGQYFDAETGLHQNWNRDYDPSIGRYLQSDPIGLEGGINTYSYVESNPLSNIDPEGLQTLVVPRPIIMPMTRPTTSQPIDPAVPLTDTGQPPPNGPLSDKCLALLGKMKNLRNEIYGKRIPDLQTNPQNLPERIGPGEALSETVRGHRTLLNRQTRRLKELEDRFDKECSPQC